ncbi:MAG TPA: Gfo/Idh/MocA family oxidoreductase [Candidatus Hydrogenedentes bacterium]|mgnify:CR=1 FL=1|nr:Gfo/Idh/MocA family oxidoreductase [Candidatus Hydrogenedentota bacterium]HPG69009.1 Gfo/Idh/MocA family oxidoreductase [Candidatus Hydrogenedentota bacterium]
MALKVAVVGMGGIGNLHARCYMKDPLAEVVAVCDIIKERADRAAAEYGCPAFYSVKDLLKSGIKIDCASMCAAGKENGGDHYKPTMELLAGGIPTLGEKPISNELPKARQMVALAKKKRLRYAVNLNHRFTPAARLAKEWVESGRLGRLHIINMTMWINNGNETSPHFHIRALHPHSIDVMRYFCGDVVKVQAFFLRGNTLEGKQRVCWSNLQANMLFKNGVVGHLTGSYDAGGGFGLERCEVTGSKGRFVLEEACEVLTFNNRVNTEKETYTHLGAMTGFGETFPSRIHRWLEQNTEKAAPSQIDGSGLDALKCQTIIEACIKSWETGKVIDVDYKF